MELPAFILLVQVDKHDLINSAQDEMKRKKIESGGEIPFLEMHLQNSLRGVR